MEHQPRKCVKRNRQASASATVVDADSELIKESPQMTGRDPEAGEERAQQHKAFFDRLSVTTGVSPLPGLGYVPRDDLIGAEDTGRPEGAVEGTVGEQPTGVAEGMEGRSEQPASTGIQILDSGSQQRRKITLLECLRQHTDEKLPDDLNLSPEQLRLFYADLDNTDRYGIVRHLANFLFVGAQTARDEGRELQVANALLKKWEEFQKNLGILRPKASYVKTALEHAFHDISECLEVEDRPAHES